MIRDEKAFAKAFASSFLVDMNRAPSLTKEIDVGRVSQRGLYNIIVRDLRRSVKGIGPVLFPNLRKVVDDWITIETAKKEIARLQAVGMGQFDFGALGSSIAGAIGGYFTAKVTSKAQTDIAKYQTQQAAIANRALELDAARARLAMIQKEGGPVEMARRTIAVKEEALAVARGEIPGFGLPWWGLGLGVLGVGALIYFAVKAA